MPSVSRTRFFGDRRQNGEVKTSRGGHPAPLAEIINAQQEGAVAVHDHVTPGQNPYLVDRSDSGRFLALMWFRGYRAEQHRLLPDEEDA